MYHLIRSTISPRRLPPARYMANLIVCNVDDEIANALKVQASKHGISAEAEHRLILEQALLRPKKKPFFEALSQIPNVGTDDDFERVQDLWFNSSYPQCKRFCCYWSHLAQPLSIVL